MLSFNFENKVQLLSLKSTETNKHYIASTYYGNYSTF